MCGIFGNITNKIENVNINNVHLLGVLNEERGTDSCGLFYDGEIYAGFEKDNSIYRNFALTINKNPTKIPILMGHTRQASAGAAITISNVHPFGFGNTEDGGFEFVGAHNGTLYNKEDLAKKFNVSLKSGDRVKIDSEILLECIYKSKNFSVLELYNGAAALSFMDLIKNKMYLFSGASSNYAGSAVTLERPLHVYVKDKNTIYYSSTFEPLVLIGGDESNVFQIENNVVYEFTPGDFENAVKHKIDRSAMTQKVEYMYGYKTNSYRSHGNNSDYNRYGGYGGYGDLYDDYDDCSNDVRLDIFNNLKNINDHTVFKNISYKYYKSVPPLSISTEPSITYALGGLYYTNSDTGKSEKSHGIYIYFEDLGYLKIADKIDEVYLNLSLLDNNFFNMKNLNFIFDESSIVWNSKDSAYIDYFTVPDEIKECISKKINLSDSRYDKYLHYFYEGVKLKTYLDFSICLSKKPTFKELSFMTSEVMMSQDHVAYKDSCKFTGVFSNLYYDYTFHEGKIVNVKLKEKIKSFVIFNYRYEK